MPKRDSHIGARKRAMRALIIEQRYDRRASSGTVFGAVRGVDAGRCWRI
jgi:hypothetical protein